MIEICIIVALTALVILAICTAINWFIDWKENVSTRMDKIQLDIDELKRKELK